MSFRAQITLGQQAQVALNHREPLYAVLIHMTRPSAENRSGRPTALRRQIMAKNAQVLAHAVDSKLDTSNNCKIAVLWSTAGRFSVE